MSSPCAGVMVMTVLLNSDTSNAPVTPGPTSAGPVAAPSRVVFPTLRQVGAVSDRDGFVQGHAAGYAAGAKVAAEDHRLILERRAAALDAEAEAVRLALTAATESFKAAAAALQRLNAATVQDAEQTLLHCSVDLAQALLGYELADGSRTAEAALNRALAGDEPGGANRIRLHPADLQALAGHAAVAAAGVDLVADSTLNPGDAVAEYQHGWLDARLATALDRASAALLADPA